MAGLTIPAGPRQTPARCLPPRAATSLCTPAALAARAASVSVVIVVVVVVVLPRPSPAGCCAAAAARCSTLHVEILMLSRHA